MRLAEFLSTERVLLPLARGDGTALSSLREATATLIERLVAGGVVKDAEKLRRRSDEARGEDIVAFTDRAFLAHFRTDAVKDLAVAMGVAPTPVGREQGEGEPQRARIVLLLLAPPRLAARYLQVLGAFARLLSDASVTSQILAATTPASLLSVPALAQYELPEELSVRDLMTEHPRTATPDTPLRDAARLMARSVINAMPVVDAGGLLLGLLSERELMRHLVTSYLQGGAPQRPTAGANMRRSVRDVMTRQVLAVSPEQPLAEVASLMTNKDVDGVPVVREGRLVGFLTRGDIVRKLIGP
ncbi:MAG: CBS domain-containing protein [Gemmatimonadota bacterium]|nr:CBS domain-containing protein [Gemmatimonadota bacterium]